MASLLLPIGYLRGGHTTGPCSLSSALFMPPSFPFPYTQIHILSLSIILTLTHCQAAKLAPFLFWWIILSYCDLFG